VSGTHSSHSYLDYADDATLSVDELELLMNVLETTEQESAKFGLHVSSAKTKVQNLGARPATCRVTVDRQNVDAVSASSCILVTNLSAMIIQCLNVSCPVSTIPLPFFRCRFAVPGRYSVSRCRCRCRCVSFLLFTAVTERTFLT